MGFELQRSHIYRNETVKENDFKIPKTNQENPNRYFLLLSEGCKVGVGSF